MALVEVKVPDIGDFDSVAVIEVLVKAGDSIKAEQSLITVESDKASMEIPSSHAGIVKELRVALGDKVSEGSVVLVLEDAHWAECRRVLRPGGALLFSVPFYPEREANLVRASEDETGRITHHLPPEYHGDPLSTDGCLAFHHFGWQLLDWVRQAGFSRVEAVWFWSRGFGYLGPNNLLFTALADAK